MNEPSSGRPAFPAALKRRPNRALAERRALAGLVALLAPTVSPGAGVINGDFDTGDTSGWQFTARGGSDFIEPVPSVYPAPPYTYPFPMSTTPLFSDVGVLSGAGHDGSPAISLYSDQSGYNFFLGPDGNSYEIDQANFTLSLFQDVQLSQGETLSGWARFCSNDYYGYGDKASVTINDFPYWSYNLMQLGRTRPGDSQSGPWQYWSFVAPADGTYRLSLNLYGDDLRDSWAYFDSIQVVPEPSSVRFLVIGLALAGAFRFRPRSHSGRSAVSA